MNRFYWVDNRTGEVKLRPGKGLRRVTRVYAVVLRDGTKKMCWPDLVGRSWWYPLDKSGPIWRGRVVKYWDTTGTDIASKARL